MFRPQRHGMGRRPRHGRRAAHAYAPPTMKKRQRLISIRWPWLRCSGAALWAPCRRRVIPIRPTTYDANRSVWPACAAIPPAILYRSVSESTIIDDDGTLVTFRYTYSTGEPQTRILAEEEFLFWQLLRATFAAWRRPTFCGRLACGLSANSETVL